MLKISTVRNAKGDRPRHEMAGSCMADRETFDSEYHQRSVMESVPAALKNMYWDCTRCRRFTDLLNPRIFWLLPDAGSLLGMVRRSTRAPARRGPARRVPHRHGAMPKGANLRHFACAKNSILPCAPTTLMNRTACREDPRHHGRRYTAIRRRDRIF